MCDYCRRPIDAYRTFIYRQYGIYTWGGVTLDELQKKFFHTDLPLLDAIDENARKLVFVEEGKPNDVTMMFERTGINLTVDEDYSVSMNLFKISSPLFSGWETMDMESQADWSVEKFEFIRSE